MKLGFYTYSYIDRLGMEIEPALETVAAAGYDGIDISATWRDDPDPALVPRDAGQQYVETANRLNLRIEACVTHIEAVVRMIDNVGSRQLKHNYDPCWLAVAGFELDHATQVLAPHIVHAHIKDHVGHYPNFEHRIAGEGELDHARYLRLLRGNGFEGFIAHECFTDMPLQYACEVGCRTLRTALREASTTCKS